jgi:hypothetical protein
VRERPWTFASVQIRTLASALSPKPNNNLRSRHVRFTFKTRKTARLRRNLCIQLGQARTRRLSHKSKAPPNHDVRFACGVWLRLQASELHHPKNPTVSLTRRAVKDSSAGSSHLNRSKYPKRTTNAINSPSRWYKISIRSEQIAPL